MFYFGRIISAFFNQLFRFLFNNRLGQKILIIIIISLIAFWCLNMTEVHAVEDTSDINYEVKSYYDGVVNDAIIRMNKYFTDYPNSAYKNNIINSNYNIYVYYGNVDGSSLNNAKPLTSRFLNIVYISKSAGDFTITNNDYIGVTGYTMYTRSSTTTYGFRFDGSAVSNVSVSAGGFYIPLFALTYTNQNLKDYILYLTNDNQQAIQQLLEDIKAEQQATNDFLTDNTMDDSNIDIPSPALDTTTQDTDTSIHNSINTLTSSLQNTITNYYERLGRLRLGYTYA